MKDSVFKAMELPLEKRKRLLVDRNVDRQEQIHQLNNSAYLLLVLLIRQRL